MLSPPGPPSIDGHQSCWTPAIRGMVGVKCVAADSAVCHHQMYVVTNKDIYPQ
ncbi:Hypothetical protein ETEE_3758 [Edwardsiella anguillarum ET080813]|uniref:Uncharacterized protein n=1 Tax=Edwardsiella anguillarum ET080813 TaxID=667120 RepID=A0A076LNL6_9GAMM|nr:Hypothetical protein ETEE_3758 [Edwardsiella anguillarum ET080813]